VAVEAAVHFAAKHMIKPVVDRNMQMVPLVEPKKDATEKEKKTLASKRELRVDQARCRRLQARELRVEGTHALDKWSPALTQNFFIPARRTWIDELKRIHEIQEEKRKPAEERAQALVNAKKEMDLLQEESEHPTFKALSEEKQNKLLKKLLAAQTVFFKLHYKRVTRRYNAAARALGNAEKAIKDFPAEVEELKAKQVLVKAEIAEYDQKALDAHPAIVKASEKFKVAEKAWKADKADEDLKAAKSAAGRNLTDARQAERFYQKKAKSARNLKDRLKLKLELKEKSFKGAKGPYGTKIRGLEEKRADNIANMEKFQAEISLCKAFARKHHVELEEEEGEMDTSE
jgi:hypothetical protein